MNEITAEEVYEILTDLQLLNLGHWNTLPTSAVRVFEDAASVINLTCGKELEE